MGSGGSGLGNVVMHFVNKWKRNKREDRNNRENRRTFLGTEFADFGRGDFAMVKRRVARNSGISTSASTCASATQNYEGGTFARVDEVGSSTSATTLAPALGRMTRDQLKRLLRERGLPIWGNKANMVHFIALEEKRNNHKQHALIKLFLSLSVPLLEPRLFSHLSTHAYYASHW